MQNNVAMNYVGQNVNISSQKQYNTICDGTYSTRTYPCEGTTDSIALDLTVVCESKWKGNITSTCPYIKSNPSCKMIIPSSLSLGTVQTVSDPCTLKSFTNTNTTCECQLSSQFSRRRLSSLGNDFQFTQSSQSSKVEINAQSTIQSEPTANPTVAPTAQPTDLPTPLPTAFPTAFPTYAPTAEPTDQPTASPTSEPTASPTLKPTFKVESPKTPKPTNQPTTCPTFEPTVG
jgi:hypothetical protein